MTRGLCRKTRPMWVWIVTASFIAQGALAPFAYADGLLLANENLYPTSYYSIDSRLAGFAPISIVDSIPSPGRSLYVSVNGSDSGTGSSTSAWRTLQYAVSKLQAGDTLYVLEGTYEAAVDFSSSGTESAYITIQGVGNVVIDGTNMDYYNPAFDTKGNDYLHFKNLTVNNSRAGVLVSAGSNHIVIDGLRTDHSQHAVRMEDASYITIRNAYATNSRNAFRAQGVTHDVFIENVETYLSKDIYDGMDLNYLNGDGFIFENQTYNVTIRNVISGDHWDAGFDIKASNVLIENVVSFGNKNGIKLWGNNITIVNALVYGNKCQPKPSGGCTEGNGLNSRRGTSTILNSTFVDNEVYELKATSESTVRLVNSIVARNVSGGQLRGEEWGSFSHNNVLWYDARRSSAGFAISSDSLFANPGFVDWANKNFRLADTSAALNRGRWDSKLPVYDLAWNARYVGDAVDIGAYENQTGVAQPPPVPDPEPEPEPSPDPTGYFTGIQSGATVSGTIFVNYNPASGLSGVQSIRYYINGTLVGRYYEAPFTMGGSAGFDTTKLADGTYSLGGTIKTSSGDVPFSLLFTVNNATPPPPPAPEPEPEPTPEPSPEPSAGYFLGVAADSTVSGTVFVRLNSEMGLTGVRSVRYYIDGSQSGRYYEWPFQWGGASGYDTRRLPNGVHVLGGTIVTSTTNIPFSITFTVQNPVPAPDGVCDPLLAADPDC